MKVLHSSLAEKKEKKKANKRIFFYKIPWLMAELQEAAG